MAVCGVLCQLYRKQTMHIFLLGAEAETTLLCLPANCADGYGRLRMVRGVAMGFCPHFAGLWRLMRQCSTRPACLLREHSPSRRNRCLRQIDRCNDVCGYTDTLTWRRNHLTDGNRFLTCKASAVNDVALHHCCWRSSGRRGFVDPKLMSLDIHMSYPDYPKVIATSPSPTLWRMLSCGVPPAVCNTSSSFSTSPVPLAVWTCTQASLSPSTVFGAPSTSSSFPIIVSTASLTAFTLLSFTPILIPATPNAPLGCSVASFESGTLLSLSVTSWHQKGTAPRSIPVGNVTFHCISTPSGRFLPPATGSAYLTFESLLSRRELIDFTSGSVSVVEVRAQSTRPYGLSHQCPSRCLGSSSIKAMSSR
jgi:hypothetical protein